MLRNLINLFDANERYEDTAAMQELLQALHAVEKEL